MSDSRVFSLNPIQDYIPPTLSGHRTAPMGVFWAGVHLPLSDNPYYYKLLPCLEYHIHVHISTIYGCCLLLTSCLGQSLLFS